MLFRQRTLADASLSYFFGCAGQGKAVAVDVVAGDEEWFIAAAREAGVDITHIIDTHVHADITRAGANWRGAPARPTACTSPTRGV